MGKNAYASIKAGIIYYSESELKHLGMYVVCVHLDKLHNDFRSKWSVNMF